MEELLSHLGLIYSKILEKQLGKDFKSLGITQHFEVPLRRRKSRSEVLPWLINQARSTSQVHSMMRYTMKAYRH